MKSISKMTQGELGAFVQTHLRAEKIELVLSGGAAVSIYSGNRFVSLDLDLVNIYSIRQRVIRDLMLKIGFLEEGRHFTHPNTQFLVEFLPGPLAIGEEPIKQIDEIQYSTGTLRIISPTDCVKDRLAAYYHWGDRQCLRQAIWVSQGNKIDLEEVRRWSLVEDQLDEFEKINPKLLSTSSR